MELLSVNEPAGWHQQHHAETEGAMPAEAAAKQPGETGTILDSEAAAQDRIRPFAFDAIATLPRPGRTAQHPGTPEGHEPGGLYLGSAPPRKLASEPFGIGIFAQGPCAVRKSLLRGRREIIKRFEKRVALVRRPVPSLWAGSDDGSNSRLEIKPSTGGPIHRQ
jgi:hypothetical protein